MVNTFLVDSDFSRSAQMLDKRRLGKQRVEAQQILNIILNLKALSIYFDIPLTNLKLAIKQIKHQFNLTEYYLMLQSDEQTIRSSCFPDLHSTDLHLIKLGFCHHPAVYMWFYHTDALKQYIDCHIEEWIKRGCKNNMKRYNIRNAIQPEWTFDEKLLINHRQALMSKEIDRKEKPWYIHNSFFTNSGQFVQYYWPADVKIKL